MISRPIIYGSEAIPLEKSPSSDHTHRWSVYVKPYHSEEEMSRWVKRVTFKLHESYPQNIRRIIFIFLLIFLDCDSSPWKVEESGWGEFQIGIKIHFQDPNQRPLILSHQLKLYPSDQNASASIPSSSSSSVVSEQFEEILFNFPDNTESPFKRIIMEENEKFPSLEMETSRYPSLLEEEEKELIILRDAISHVENEINELDKLPLIEVAPSVQIMEKTSTQTQRKSKRH